MAMGLKKFIMGKSPSYETAPADTADTAVDLSLLKTVAPENISSAREAVWNNISEFEAALQQVARLPEQFRLMMTPVENAVGNMALLRNRLENSETALAEETQRSTDLAQDKANLTTELAQLQTALKLEEASANALRQQNGTLESSNLQLSQDHAALQSALNQMEPQIRELTTLRHALQAELDDLRHAKDHADKTISELHTELNTAIDTISDRNNFLSNLQLTNERLRERLDNAGKSISELECAVMQLEEKYNAGKVDLNRERKMSASLRIENLQLRKDAEEARVQSEGEIETLLSRHHFLDQALADSRARLTEESRQLSQTRLERVDRDREIGRLKLALESTQRETNELRAQLNAASASAASTNQLLSGEIEIRHRLELELDMLRNENSTLLIKNKGLAENARLADMAHGDTVQKLQARLAKLAAENDQLRSVMRVANDHDDNHVIKSA
jgi:chromosome segregation ATPase